MDKKINLDEIIKYQMRLQNATDIIYMDNGQQGNLKDANFIVKKSMLEFGKQLLELAAKNAKLKCQLNPHPMGYPFAMYNPNGVMENNDLWIVTNKQSILDTIKQIDNG